MIASRDGANPDSAPRRVPSDRHPADGEPSHARCAGQPAPIDGRVLVSGIAGAYYSAETTGRLTHEAAQAAATAAIQAMRYQGVEQRRDQ